MDAQEFGPYLLVEQIAVGGMAQIYLAKTQGIAGFEKFLALKLLHPSYATDDQFVTMLIEEAKIAVRLNHANIAQVFDLGRSDDVYYIAMEFVDGADLFKIMRRLSERDFDVPLDVAVYIAQELCTGLDYAHRQRDARGQPLNIIHRDISPQNILVSRAGEVKIVDFGIAKATSRSQATQAGVIKGKYYYMSPEQAWGDPIDQRTDIFSAGIILYEVLTGQMLYLQEDMHKLIELVRRADIPSPRGRRPEIPAELEQILMKALAKRPEDRWQSAHDFQLALTHFLFSYAPDFTSARLARVVEHALEEAAEEEQPPKAAPAHATGQSPARDGKVRTQQFPVDDLMSRADFRPEAEQSVIFRLEDLGGVMEEDDEDPADEDLGEATMVTARPAQFGRDSSTDVHADAWEEVQGDPTLVARVPTEGARRPEESLPEVVIPLREDDREDPTLVEERSAVAHRMRPPPPAAAQRPAPSPPPIPPPVPPAAGSWPPPPAAPAQSWPPFAPAPAPARAPTPSAAPAQPQWPPVQRDRAPTGPPPQVAPVGAGQWHPDAVAQTVQMVAAPPAPANPVAGHAAVAGIGAAVAGRPAAPSDWGGPPEDSMLTALPNVAEWPSARSRRRRRMVIATLATALTLASIAAIAFFALWPINDEPAVVQVISVPLGAEVWLDGTKAAKPTGVSIPVADPSVPHKLEVRMAHYEPWTSTVTFPEGQRYVRALAVLNPIYGKLQVESEPSGADVYLNGEHRGRTPATIEGLALTEEISLELRKRGYRPETRTVTWEDQRFRKISIPLRRSR